MNQDSNLETEIWKLCREDNEGNHYLVQGGLTKEGAEKLKNNYESKRDKKIYVVERVISMNDNSEKK